MRLFKIIVWMVVIFFSLSVEARPVRQPLKKLEIGDPKKGFELGIELNVLTLLHTEAAGIPLPGKFDVTLGYRFNPYFSLSADLWSFWLIAYGAEIKPKVNFLPGKISPFIAATFGGVAVPIFFNWENDADSFRSFLTYSVGPGLDVQISKRTTLTTNVRYRGMRISDKVDQATFGHMIEGGVGWVFNF